MRYDIEFLLKGPKGNHHRAFGVEFTKRKPSPEAFGRAFAEDVREIVEDCVREDMEGAEMIHRVVLTSRTVAEGFSLGSIAYADVNQGRCQGCGRLENRTEKVTRMGQEFMQWLQREASADFIGGMAQAMAGE